MREEGLEHVERVCGLAFTSVRLPAEEHNLSDLGKIPRIRSG